MHQENPIIDALRKILLQHCDNPVQGERTFTEYDLIQGLFSNAEAITSAENQDTRLALFQKHFLLRNALFQLQDEFLTRGYYLDIGPVHIQIGALKENMVASHPTDASVAKLREYYLDWRHFQHTDSAEVNRLLSSFWSRYLAIDQQDEAFDTLGLPTDANWSTIKSRYRKLAAEHHPDKGGESAAFNRIRKAYEVLKQCKLEK